MHWIGRVVWPGLLSLAVGMVTPCNSQVVALPAPERHLQPVIDRFWGPAWSNASLKPVMHPRLADFACHCPRDAFTYLEQRNSSLSDFPEQLLTLAELADQIGRTKERREPGEAIVWSRDAAVYAIFCLAALRPSETDTTSSCAASDVHNREVARCLRLIQSYKTPGQSTWPTTLVKAGIVLSTPIGEWTALGLDSLEATAECVSAPGESTTVRHRHGLGIPVIVQRRLKDTELTIWKPYGPRDVVFAATAVIQPVLAYELA